MTKEKKYFLIGVLVGIVPGMLGFYGFVRLMHSSELGGQIEKYSGVATTLIPIFLILGAVLFVSGSIKYFVDLRKHNEKTIAKRLLFSGLLLIILMVASWGILGWFQTPLLLESASGPGGI